MLTGARFFAFAPAAALAALLLLGASPAPVAVPEAPPATSLPAPGPTAEGTVAILAISITPDPVKAGKAVNVMVHTTPNVLQLNGRVLGHSFVMPKTGDGVFSGSGNVPWWARFYHGTLNITFTATGDRGASAQMEQTIRL